MVLAAAPDLIPRGRLRARPETTTRMMRGFIAELTRREMFRTAGLYVGIVWIIIEGASVLLPAFEAPDSVLRWLIILAFVGFPVTMVLAWVFDITDHGIEFEKPADEASTVVVPPTSRTRPATTYSRTRSNRRSRSDWKERRSSARTTANRHSVSLRHYSRPTAYWMRPPQDWCPFAKASSSC